MDGETVKTAGVINRTGREVDKDQRETKKNGSGILNGGRERSFIYNGFRLGVWEDKWEGPL